MSLKRKKLRFAAARLMGLRVRILLGALIFFFCECLVLSSRVFARGWSHVQRSPT